MFCMEHAQQFSFLNDQDCGWRNGRSRAHSNRLARHATLAKKVIRAKHRNHCFLAGPIHHREFHAALLNVHDAVGCLPLRINRFAFPKIRNVSCHPCGIEKDLRVAWFTLESLAAAIGRARADGSVARTVTRICRCDLIVVDDIGMLPAGQDAAEAFYRITDAAYERRSLAVTSNIHPSGFDTIMPKTLATATVDRLLHHAHLVQTAGDSHRLAEALAGKGVVTMP